MLWLACELKSLKRKISQFKEENDILLKKNKTVCEDKKRLYNECMDLKAGWVEYHSRFLVASAQLERFPSSLRNPTSKSLPALYPLGPLSQTTSEPALPLDDLGFDAVYAEIYEVSSRRREIQRELPPVPESCEVATFDTAAGR